VFVRGGGTMKRDHRRGLAFDRCRKNVGLASTPWSPVQIAASARKIALALGQEGALVSVHDLHANEGACETVHAVLHEGVQAIAMQTHLSRGRDRAR
jgi:hypothetical protein